MLYHLSRPLMGPLRVLLELYRISVETERYDDKGRRQLSQLEYYQQNRFSKPLRNTWVVSDDCQLINYHKLIPMMSNKLHVIQ